MNFWQSLRYGLSNPYTRGEPPVDERTATLEAALRTIRSSIPGYLKGEMTEHDFALLVLGEVDSGKVNKALEGKK